MTVIPYVLFFLAGLGFGFAANGKWKWAPLGFPILLWIGAVLVNGVDAVSVLRLVLALAITAGGVLLGMVLDRRERREPAAEAG